MKCGVLLSPKVIDHMVTKTKVQEQGCPDSKSEAKEYLVD